MKKGLTIVAVAAFALGAAACHKSDTNSADTSNVSAEDNMLVPADENAMMGGNDTTATDNMMGDNSAMAGNDTNAM